MPITKHLDGNHAAAWAVRLCRAQVLPVYPITPQTPCITQLAEWIGSGEMEAEYIPVESESAAMGAGAGASAAGARVFTASSSQGIVYMEGAIWMVAGFRLPIVMAIVNRAIAFPALLLPDLNDSLLQRDSGWLQFYCQDAQEVLDTGIQLYRIAEDEKVYLPAILAYEGFVVGHAAMPVEIPDQDDVDKFLPPYKHKYVSLDPDVMVYKPAISPPIDSDTELRYQMDEAQMNALKLIPEINEEYGKMTGRRYGNGLIEKYRCEDAEALLITMGSIAGTARAAIDELREEGKPVGLVRIRTFRPFPSEALREAVKGVKAIGFMDRNICHGSAGGGIGCIETARALYSLEERPPLIGFFTGISGRDVTPSTVREIAETVLKTAETGKIEEPVVWSQLRR